MRERADMGTLGAGGHRAGGDSGADDAADEERQIYRELLARAPENAIEPDLDRMRAVCALLGDPQSAAPVIHVTGTNGKTSTTRMIDRLVRERGLRTGRFTSPHLTSVRERIAIDGEPISAETFVRIYRDVEPYLAMVDAESVAVGGPRMTFFEALTAMAFVAFADAPVDVVILEVGMGGTWDATNVADGKVAVITPISRDHEQWLGSDLAGIAREKAGIIKDGSTLVLGPQDERVLPVLVDAAAAHAVPMLRDGTELAVLERELAVGGQVITLRTPVAVYADIYLPLHGEYQAHNALLALAATEAFFGSSALPAEVVETAFGKADSPGRMELVRTSPPVLVDVAHNPAGVEATMAALEEAFAFARTVGVVGILADKDAESMLAAMEPVLAEVVITRSSSPRAVDVGDLARIAVDVFGADRVQMAERLDDAIELAVTAAEAGAEPSLQTRVGVLIVGSATLAAEARILFARP